MIYHLPYDVLTPGELRPGMVAVAHGMRVLIVDEPTLSRSHAGGRTFWTRGVVLNRDEVPGYAVPYSFTTPHLPNGYPDQALIDQGVHTWTFQGNDLASVAVEVHGPITEAVHAERERIAEQLAAYDATR